MIAMRYGTIPVVRATGGLKDTVTADVGFAFEDVSSTEMFEALRQALDIYYEQPDKWYKMQAAGMQKDFSWRVSAKEYMMLYKKLV
jgi:starch synthase